MSRCYCREGSVTNQEELLGYIFIIFVPSVNTANISTIARHRIGLDGYGVVTLVVMNGCPLRCKYCINRFALEGESSTFTPDGLLKRMMQDNLYFLASGGGITFGGGEPLLWAAFIKDFCSICDTNWTISVETSLNVPLENLESIAEDVDLFIIDIKDMDLEIYRSYTGTGNERVLKNLQYLSENGYSEKCIIRLPLIPSYNTEENIFSSEKILEGMGFSRFNKFNYRKPDEQ